jgi:hypothetical protein
MKNSEQTQKLLQLLIKAQHLGLNLFVGSAYISRAYIDKQNALNAEIDAVIKELSNENPAI